MDSRFFVATRKGLFTAQSSGKEWKIGRGSFVGDNVPIVLPDRRDNTVYAALAHGHFGAKLHCSKDGGQTWEEIGVPTYPERPVDADDKCPMRGVPIPWKLELVWSLVGGGPDRPGLLWCGTLPGGLFKSEDSGRTWSLVRSLWDKPERKEWFGGGMDWPGIHSICVDPRDSRCVTLGISCGGVWVTRDCGDTWKCQADGMRAEYMPPEQAGHPNIQDPHCVVQCRREPDVMWAQHHNGIFKTTDGAASWHEVKNVHPSAFGFSVAVHPEDGKTAWFVPAVKDEKRYPVDARVVVTRTRDGGRSFETLSKGLPQENAYDITFRHSLDIDSTGQCLAFGSTTGSLWVSKNQGDSWECVSSHLPPVYCVRFAN